MKNTKTWLWVALLSALVAFGGSCGNDSPDEAMDGGLDGSSDLDTDGDGDGDGDSDGDSDTDTDNDTNTYTDDVCDQSDFEIYGVEVDMLIVLDRSNSMCDQSLWSPMAEGIKQVTADLQDKVNFGLLFFPSLSCAGAVAQCSVPSVPHVAINSANAVQDIATAVGPPGEGCCGGTPIAQALTAAKTYLDTVDDGLRKFVLLATDGAPNCNEALDGEECTCTYIPDPDACKNPDPGYNLMCLDDLAANSAASQLEQAGYDTYVLGVGDSLQWQAVMNDLASNGGTGSYYPVSDPEQLTTTLQTIVGQAITCQFDIDWDSLGSTVDHDPNKVNFYGDGVIIYYDEDCTEGVGWNWVDGDTVEFCADACADLKNGTWTTVTATFGCKPIVLPESMIGIY